jgi:citrate lyase beta subunit
MRARRALLYMPGDDQKKIRKAITLGVDSICMDIEDGVAMNRKAEARAVITNSLKELDFGAAERLVRINPVGSGLEEEDLMAVLPIRPDGIVIPKVADASSIRWADEGIERFTRERGETSTSQQIVLIAIVETALGVINLKEIASSSPRLQALIFGAEDLAGDIGAIRTPAGWEVFYARSAVVAHAAANSLQAIDMVYVDFLDQAGLEAEARQGVQMGFSGKQIIHPNQVEPVQRAFTPSDEEIEHARRVMESYAKHQQAGLGAFALDGKMVDAPIVKAAGRVLSRARAAGKI